MRKISIDNREKQELDTKKVTIVGILSTLYVIFKLITIANIQDYAKLLRGEGWISNFKTLTITNLKCNNPITI